MPAGCHAAPRLAALGKVLELAAAIRGKARNVIAAGTEQEPGAAERVTRQRGSSGSAGVGNFTEVKMLKGRCFSGLELRGFRQLCA